MTAQFEDWRIFQAPLDTAQDDACLWLGTKASATCEHGGSSWAGKALQDSLGLKQSHKGIEGSLSFCSAVGRSKREMKDQLPLKERGREAFPVGLTYCSLAAKNCTAFAFPLSCGKFMDINEEIIPWIILWSLGNLHFAFLLNLFFLG